MRVKRVAHEQYIADHPDDKFDYVAYFNNNPVVVASQSRVDPDIYVLHPNYVQICKDAYDNFWKEYPVVE